MRNRTSEFANLQNSTVPSGRFKTADMLFASFFEAEPAKMIKSFLRILFLSFSDFFFNLLQANFLCRKQHEQVIEKIYRFFNHSPFCFFGSRLDYFKRFFRYF